MRAAASPLAAARDLPRKLPRKPCMAAHAGHPQLLGALSREPSPSAAVAGKLSQDEYPYVQTPSSPGPGSASVPGSRDGTPTSAVASARTMRTTTGAWARKAGGTPDKEAGSSKVACAARRRRDGAAISPGATDASPDPHSARALQGKRVFVFVLGGITHSEMRTTHRLSAKMGRDIYLGGTSVETPSTFLGHMSELGHVDQVALEIESPGGRFRF